MPIFRVHLAHTLVIAAREDIEIARQARAPLSLPDSGPGQRGP
jgi:hypothetical protein